jgi:hypothetical protein
MSGRDTGKDGIKRTIRKIGCIPAKPALDAQWQAQGEQESHGKISGNYGRVIFYVEKYAALLVLFFDCLFYPAIDESYIPAIKARAVSFKKLSGKGIGIGVKLLDC